MRSAVLALDCSGETYSCGVLCDGEFLIKLDGLNPRLALKEMPHHIGHLFNTTGATREDVVAVGVTQGPGSFTGVRLGLSIAKSLALASNCGVFGIDTLELMATPWSEAMASGSRIAVALDARRKEIYCSLFQLAEKGLKSEVSTGVRSPSEFRDCLNEGGPVSIFLGQGFAAYPELVPQCHAGPVLSTRYNCVPPVETLLKLSYEAWQNDALVHWRDLVPHYHRRADIQVSGS